MLYPEPALVAKLYHVLAYIDLDLEQRTRAARCPHCGGPLHDAHYDRKPRGGPPLPDCMSVRLGLCCGHCRRRTLPPSILFLGRKVYWGAVIVMIAAARQRRPTGASASKLHKQFGVSWQTVKRWMRWFSEIFPASGGWQCLRGRFAPDLRDDDLPASLLEIVVPDLSPEALSQRLKSLRAIGQLWAIATSAI